MSQTTITPIQALAAIERMAEGSSSRVEAHRLRVTRDELLVAVRAYRRAQKIKRPIPCMCCRKTFLSSGPGNRLCQPCATGELVSQPDDFSLVRPR